MKKRLIVFVHALLLLACYPAICQKAWFNKIFSSNTSYSGIVGIAQDRYGMIWLASQTKGLQRYDGTELTAYDNEALTSPLEIKETSCITIGPDNIIWTGSDDTGLSRYDPATSTFTHFRHSKTDSSSLISDEVESVLTDHNGQLWIGTSNGLDKYDKKTGKFIHYLNRPGDVTSISDSYISVIYEDHRGNLWIGCGIRFEAAGKSPGGLDLLDPATGKFTRYNHNAHDPRSIADDRVCSLFEDSKGNFWVGTCGDGLQTLDRNTGWFTHYYHDLSNPSSLNRPPLCVDCLSDPINFITEDPAGAIWIGSHLNGINEYEPGSKKLTHYGPTRKYHKDRRQTDTAAGAFTSAVAASAFVSKDGILWIGSYEGELFTVDAAKNTLPFYPLKGPNANTFYYDNRSGELWIGTDQGLLRRGKDGQDQQWWKHAPLNSNSLSNDTIDAMRPDDQGNLWLATANGLCKFDPVANHFTAYHHNEKNPGSLGGNNINSLFFDHDKNLWIGSNNFGLDKMDPQTGDFTHYANNNNDSSSLGSNLVNSVNEDRENNLWVGTDLGLNLLNRKTGKFRYYLKASSITNIFTDHSGVLWLGANDGAYYYDKPRDRFLSYTDPDTKTTIRNVVHIMEDDQKNLWVSTNNSFIKINETRNGMVVYNETNGVHTSNFTSADNLKAPNGQLFFGDQTGYYTFSPAQLPGMHPPPEVIISAMKLGDEDITLEAHLSMSEEIKLAHSQNVFSFDYDAVSYRSTGKKKYLFMLENYDNNWHATGSDHKAYYFNVPPGSYIFHARVVDGNNLWGEKTIRIVISPPWWRTWWATLVFALSVAGALWTFISYRSRRLRRTNQLLEEKVTLRTSQLNKSLEELRSAQTQLIQSEKMASLGELTAGIAHEIQNPLNFVNNFSEVNGELIDELKEEAIAGHTVEVLSIAGAIKENGEKITHHGKRADAIVKGMLQHSRSNTGAKELSEINALADEYLRLAYHGVRAKDSSFNAAMKTDFDETIGRMNIIPQDIGRVLLNLYNNAFYAVNEKKKQQAEGYEPIISVSTKKVDNKITITVKDNGNGIPQKVLDKIFQPFFTTKPTGQGTGLGLSLSYDIIKAHGGELKVNSQEGGYAQFIVLLPF